jgi:hypothetical protein
MKYRREIFLRNKEEIPDEHFLQQLRIESVRERRIAIVLRRVMAQICSITPEMISPSDQPKDLCGIMDWGMPNWGWLFSVDYGAFSDNVDFGVRFEDEYCKLTGESIHKSQQSDWADYLPNFAGYRSSHSQKNEEAKTFGEWIRQTIEIVVAHTRLR